MVLLIFLSSGLFLAWSLGANNAANVFGPAVGTRMVRFSVAAAITSVFVILGAVIDGAGASQTLGKLGAVNALGGSFTIALCAAITVTVMTKAGLPVSTSQAIVGGIIGWNFFTGHFTDVSSLIKIVSTWVLSPILAAVFALLLFKLFRYFLSKIKLHLFYQDTYTRWAFLLAGAFGAYSLGANNIANAMGVFVEASPFHAVNIYGILQLNSTQLLFLLGSIAIGIGVITYSQQVMKTVGGKIFHLSPTAGLIVVLSEALVLFLFGSRSLQSWLLEHGLPAIPLVPVSSSQAVVGAVLGIALAKGGKNINFKVLGRIAMGWVASPVMACVLAFVSLFVVQNVFDQQVHKNVRFALDVPVMERLEQQFPQYSFEDWQGKSFDKTRDFRYFLDSQPQLSRNDKVFVWETAQLTSLVVSACKLEQLQMENQLNSERLAALKAFQDQGFVHAWQLQDVLAEAYAIWQKRPDLPQNVSYNKKLSHDWRIVWRAFRIEN